MNLCMFCNKTLVPGEVHKCDPVLPPIPKDKAAQADSDWEKFMSFVESQRDRVDEAIDEAHDQESGE